MAATMTTWTLIIWVLHHQLALTGYATEGECVKAAEMAKVRAQGVTTIYCIPGPK